MPTTSIQVPKENVSRDGGHKTPFVLSTLSLGLNYDRSTTMANLDWKNNNNNKPTVTMKTIY